MNIKEMLDLQRQQQSFWYDVKQLSDSQRSEWMDELLLGLYEEVGELAQAIRKGNHEERVHEFGDVLAWTFSLANQVGVDIEKAIQRYIDTPP